MKLEIIKPLMCNLNIRKLTNETFEIVHTNWLDNLKTDFHQFGEIEVFLYFCNLPKLTSDRAYTIKIYRINSVVKVEFRCLICYVFTK